MWRVCLKVISRPAIFTIINRFSFVGDGVREKFDSVINFGQQLPCGDGSVKPLPCEPGIEGDRPPISFLHIFLYGCVAKVLVGEHVLIGIHEVVVPVV